MRSNKGSFVALCSERPILKDSFEVGTLKLTILYSLRDIVALLNERRLIQQAPLSALADTRIGIDVSQYLRQILTSDSTREPLIAATGGLPIALTAHIEADLRILGEHRIKPVFVFNGLPLYRRNIPRHAQEVISGREAAQRNHAWGLYEQGHAEESANVLTEGQRHGNWVVPIEVTRLILRMFRHRMVEYIVAPYMQWGQVSRKSPTSHAEIVHAHS